MFQEFGVTILESCILPKSKIDITVKSMDTISFDDFKNHLTRVLPILFDLISAHEGELLTNELKNLMFQTLLAEFLFEQCGECDFFRTEEVKLNKHVGNLEGKIIHLMKDPAVFHYIRKNLMKVYKDKLSGDNWKKNPGAIYGLVRFCHVFHSGTMTFQMNLVVGKFILSIATQLMENSSFVYLKVCGLKLFKSLLETYKTAIFLKENINDVIFTHCKDNFDKITSPVEMELLWNCTTQTFFQTTTLNMSDVNFDWKKVDDCFKYLINNLQLGCFDGINPTREKVLQNALGNVVALSMSNCDDPELSDSVGDITAQFSPKEQKALRAAKRIRGDEFNVKSYRWVKSLFDYFMCLLGTLVRQEELKEDAEETIKFVLITYLMTVSCVKEELLEELLTEFISKILKVCAEILDKYRNAGNSCNKILVIFMQKIHKRMPLQNITGMALGKLLARCESCI
ncbi:uncharacterized protein DMENIID0001_017500 [Sergentomyia squamirostris]